MRRQSSYLLVLWFSTIAMAGCAQFPRDAGFQDVRQLVKDRPARAVMWRQDESPNAMVASTINEILTKEMTVDDAVQVGLLSNRRVQATLEELGITQADVVQAGLLRNPSLSVRPRWASPSQGTGSNVEIDLVFYFVDMVLVPARKRLAQQQFEQVKLQVTDQVLGYVADVEKQFLTLQGTTQAEAMRRAVYEAGEASYELAKRMNVAGNLSELQLARERGQLEQARVDLARATADLQAARESLTRVLGLWGKDIKYRIAAKLPEVPSARFPLDRLESFAMEQRLDIQAAKMESETLAQAVGITRDYRWMLLTEIGPDTERDFDGTWLTGPHFVLELPIFDQKQATIARAVAQLRQSEHRLFAMAVEARSDVRAARDRLVAARDLAEHYRKVVIPAREQIVRLSMKQFNFMLVGVNDVLLAKRDQYDAYQQYIDAVRDYWIARSELRRVVGGKLPPGWNDEATPEQQDVEAVAPSKPIEAGKDDPHRNHK